METSGLVAAYLQWHLEHGIRSLRHVERDTGSADEAAPAREAPADDTDIPRERV
jgi:DNA repair protein RecO (recombination protein O)